MIAKAPATVLYIEFETATDSLARLVESRFFAAVSANALYDVVDFPSGANLLAAQRQDPLYAQILDEFLGKCAECETDLKELLKAK